MCCVNNPRTMLNPQSVVDEQIILSSNKDTARFAATNGFSDRFLI